jgi:hypothetical protein
MSNLVCLLIGLGLGYFAGTHPEVVNARFAALGAWIKLKTTKG